MLLLTNQAELQTPQLRCACRRQRLIVLVPVVVAETSVEADEHEVKVDEDAQADTCNVTASARIRKGEVDSAPCGLDDEIIM